MNELQPTFFILPNLDGNDILVQANQITAVLPRFEYEDAADDDREMPKRGPRKINGAILGLGMKKEAVGATVEQVIALMKRAGLPVFGLSDINCYPAATRPMSRSEAYGPAGGDD